MKQNKQKEISECCEKCSENWGGGNTMIPLTRKCSNLDCSCHKPKTEEECHWCIDSREGICPTHKVTPPQEEVKKCGYCKQQIHPLLICREYKEYIKLQHTPPQTEEVKKCNCKKHRKDRCCLACQTIGSCFCGISQTAEITSSPQPIEGEVKDWGIKVKCKYQHLGIVEVEDMVRMIKALLVSKVKELENKCADSFHPYCGGDKPEDVSCFDKLQVIIKKIK